MDLPTVAAFVGCGGLGAVAGRGLSVRGLDDLDLRGADVVIDCLARSWRRRGQGGAAALAASLHARSWWWLPALFVWAVTMTSAATCDQRCQRIPTPILRAGGGLTTPLLVLAASVRQDWNALTFTAVACAASSAILLICWRFFGAGFGDVRLAGIGGLGLGHATLPGVGFAVLLFAAVLVAQSIHTYTRTHDPRTHVALGPALAAGFLVAAIV